MTPEQAANLCKLLKTTPVPYDGGGWVKAPCPLARWTHQSKKDSNPSFGISIKPGQRSHYHCFACSSGSLSDLAGALTMHLQKNADLMALYPLKQIFQMVEDEELTVYPLPDFEAEDENPYAAFQEWPAYFIESFLPWNLSKDCVDYLKKRGVTKDQAIAHNLRWDAQHRRVVFPYKSVYGKLAGARGRAVDDGVDFKHFDYTWNKVNNAGLVWYNEEVFENEQPIVVVEGQFDCLTVERCYPHVIANLTAKPSPFKMKRLQAAEGLVFMTDNDEAGQQAMEKYIAYAQVHKLDFYPLYLPKEYDEQGKLIKLDPDKLGTEWIREKLTEIGLLAENDLTN